METGESAYTQPDVGCVTPAEISKYANFFPSSQPRQIQSAPMVGKVRSSAQP